MKTNTLLTILNNFSALLVIAAAIFGVYYFTHHKKQLYKQEYRHELHILFDDIGALYTTAKFRIRGVQVGYVEEIFYEKGYAIARILAKQSMPIYQNYHVTMNAFNAMGGYYVELDPGDDSQPLLFESLDGIRLFGYGIAEPSGVVSRILEDFRGDIYDIINNLRLVSEKIDRGDGTIGQIINNDESYERAMRLIRLSEDILRDVERYQNMESHDSSRGDGTRNIFTLGKRGLR